MALGDRVLYAGQVYTIVGHAGEIREIDESQPLIELFVALNKEEGGEISFLKRAVWVPYEHTQTLISSFDFRESEFFRGVFSGNS